MQLVYWIHHYSVPSKIINTAGLKDKKVNKKLIQGLEIT